MQKPVTNLGYISTSSVAGRGVFAKMAIKKGDLVFIIGKVGSGKSTLLNALIGDLLPVS